MELALEHVTGGSRFTPLTMPRLDREAGKHPVLHSEELQLGSALSLTRYVVRVKPHFTLCFSEVEFSDSAVAYNTQCSLHHMLSLMPIPQCPSLRFFF